MTNLNYARIVGALFVGVTLATASAVAQTTWNVDDDAPGDPGPGDPTVSDPLEDGSAEHPFDAIQEGINTAANGDTVLVHNGTYSGNGNKNLDFGGRLITVRSESGPETCIIDCENDGRAFHFHSGEGLGAAVAGFTIRNGYATDHGGGILCESSSSPRITDCVLTSNTAEIFGGGIACQRSSPIICNCTISENLSLNDGGGISCEANSRPTISNCTISNNLALSDGGGLRCRSGSDGQIINCRITDNRASVAAGVSCHASSPKLANCTIANNTASSRGGGVWCYFYSAPKITNCILWGNTPDQIYREGSGDNPRVRFCDVEGGWPDFGNIDAAPLFVDADGPDDDPNTGVDNDYGLQAGSPCIDAGCNWRVAPDVADLDDDGNTDEITPLDLDGEGRFFDESGVPDTGCGNVPITDMGAYEFGGTGPAPCFGDFDGDNDVDLADLATLLANYGTSWTCEGDLDCDGDVDLNDLSALLAVYGTTCE